MSPSQLLPGHHGAHARSSSSSTSHRHELSRLAHAAFSLRRPDAFDQQLINEHPQQELESSPRSNHASPDGTLSSTSHEPLTSNLARREMPTASRSASTKPQLASRSSSRLQVVGKAVAATRRFGMTQDWRRPPGIDPRRVDLPGLHVPCVIQVVDCSQEMAKFRVLDNSNIEAFLKEPKPQGSKLRYIHVNGLSWDVIKVLGLHFELHPLSLEDMLHHDNASGVRSKADYFRRHLFVSLLVHKLAEEIEDDEDDTENGSSSLHGAARFHRDEEMVTESTHQSRETLAVPSEDDEALLSHADYVRDLTRAFKELKALPEPRSRDLNHTAASVSDRYRKAKPRSKLAQIARDEGRAARWTVAELTKDAKIQVNAEQLSVFLLEDTVVSFSQDPGFHPQLSSVFDRIATRDDLIRDSGDPSMLLHAILDVVVDDALEVVDGFRDRLTRLEARVLSTPDVDDVRELHILSSQLLLLKSTFSPLQFLISSLRTQDEAKYAATLGPNLSPNEGERRGYMSHQARLYLGDVLDHIESVLSNLELFGDMAENLISFAFNVNAESTNNFMKALSVLSSFFLPLTFLSGYFGMNFERFPHVLDGDIAYFWKCAIPTAVATIVIFSWTYIRGLITGIKRDVVRLKHRRLATQREKAL